MSVSGVLSMTGQSTSPIITPLLEWNRSPKMVILTPPDIGESTGLTPEISDCHQIYNNGIKEERGERRGEYKGKKDTRPILCVCGGVGTLSIT